jgi:predicted anti-sigma-YlaC factor YlaD
MLHQLNEYIDGEIEEELCREIEHHLANCPDCQLIVNTLSRTITLYRSLADVEVELPDEVEARLLDKLSRNLP